MRWLWFLPLAASGATLEPRDIVLAGPGAEQRLVASGCTVSAAHPNLVRIDTNRVIGLAPGLTTLHCGNASVRVEVRNQPTHQLEPRFSPDIISLLTIKGCNGSGCHGSPAGQNGFKLSLFGYDVAADHAAVLSRINLADPEKSLLLRKPLFDAPHGGGRLLSRDSDEYRTLLAWLRLGAPRSARGARLTSLEIAPREALLNKSPQPLAVIGRLSDGTTRDMTREVRFSSADPAVARVENDSLQPGAPGLTTILARAMGLVAALRVGVTNTPHPAPSPFPPANLIDRWTGPRMAALGLTPAPPTTNSEFLRRVYLDTLGRPPLPAETTRFLAQPDRPALINQLLASPEYASFWTVKFEDWFRNNQLNSQGRAMGMFKEWLHAALAADRPYDQLVRDILTSDGDSFQNPATAFWAPATDFMLKKFEVNRAVPTVTRLFLGIRLECAECHNHPLENYTQDDFYGLSAFFARLRVKHGIGEYRRTWFLEDEGEVHHPVTRQPVAPKLLNGPALPLHSPTDRRQILAAWITSKDNPYFALATVNRIWHEYFQTGIVEPFDDLRLSNPPTNPELLDALAQHFIASGFRLKELHRLILNSRTYQLSSRPSPQPGAPPALERLLFARYQPRKLPAEVLLDSLSQVTAIPHPFTWHPKGTRAVDVYQPDGPDQFLVTFGFPRRDILCERAAVPTLAQSLHLMNGKTIQAKVDDKDNILAQWEPLPNHDVVSALYLRAYARHPNDRERAAALDFLNRAANRRKALEGLLWATLVSKEFQLNY